MLELSPGDSLLPPELAGAPPAPAPKWVRQQVPVWPVLGSLASAGLVAWGLALETVAPALVGAAVAAAVAVDVALRRRLRLLLKRGRPLVGRLQQVDAARPTAVYVYELEGIDGPRTGRFEWSTIRVVSSFGVWPEPGDRVFLLQDPEVPDRVMVWGFAPPPGQPPRQPPLPHRLLPTWVGVVVVGGLLAALVGAVVRLTAGR